MTKAIDPKFRAARRKISGWGNFPVEDCALYRPERREQLQELVTEAPEASVIPRGLGRAYGDAALNRGAAILLGERLDRILDFDPETGEPLVLNSDHNALDGGDTVTAGDGGNFGVLGGGPTCWKSGTETIPSSPAGVRSIWSKAS